MLGSVHLFVPSSGRPSELVRATLCTSTTVQSYLYLNTLVLTPMCLIVINSVTSIPHVSGRSFSIVHHSELKKITY